MKSFFIPTYSRRRPITTKKSNWTKWTCPLKMEHIFQNLNAQINDGNIHTRKGDYFSIPNLYLNAQLEHE